MPLTATPPSRQRNAVCPRIASAMVQQKKGSSMKKRKRSKSTLENNEPRKQNKHQDKDEQTETQPVDAAFLRLLTGKDEEGSAGRAADENVTGSVDDGAVDTEEKRVPEEVGKEEALGWPQVLSEEHGKKVHVTVLLENANLEVVKQNGRGGGSVLLNCDDHQHILKKTKRSMNEARPDITHQCLLTLLDSPLNKSGRLRVYVRTCKKVLIEIHPQTRMPRTIRRFCGLMTEVLEKLKVRGTSGHTPLLRVIRNPITSHLQVGTRKVVCSYNSDNVVDVRRHAARMATHVVDGMKPAQVAQEDEIREKGQPVHVLYVVGAMAHGKVDEDWADDEICISQLPLSAATVCARITYAYEALFGVL